MSFYLLLGENYFPTGKFYERLTKASDSGGHTFNEAKSACENQGKQSVDIFAFNTKVSTMAMLSSKNCTVAKKWLPPVGLGLMITGSRVMLILLS